jgi:hypothetical protein
MLFCASKTVLRTSLFASAMLVFATSEIQARSRDDVIAGMFRCAVIGDTRTWLDCYYGAAQSLRADLGLQPAPPEQVRLSQNPPAGPPSGDLSRRYQATADALRCNSFSDDRQWLNCYYGSVQPVRAQLGLSPAPQAPLTGAGGAAASVFTNPPQPSRSATAGSSDRTAFPGWSQVASYSFDRYGIFTVVLASGQQWRQLSGDTNFAHWTKPAANYWVRITRGALRSLNLKIKGEVNAYKVEQIN